VSSASLHSRRKNARRIALWVTLLLSWIPMAPAKPQSQTNKSKCSPVPVRKLEYELPKDLKGYKSNPTIKFVIEVDGSVSSVLLLKSSGSKALDETLLDAVKKSSYQPLKSGCGPIESKATVTIHLF
jgi:TonB family protein